MKRKTASSVGVGAAEAGGGDESAAEREAKIAAFHVKKLPHKGEKHDEYQAAAFRDIVNGHSVFITGAGGCGKTFLLRDVHYYLRTHKYQKGAMTSMTGVTAMMINGKTFSSFFGFGIEEGDKHKMWECVRKKAYLGKRFRELSVIVIDEISMLSAEMLEAASHVAAMFRKNPQKPFGGLQVILCGDFSQLPPINGAYAFLSPLWDEMNLRYHELKGNHRQSTDIGFYMMLNSVRVGNVDTYVRNTLKERVNAKLDVPEGVEPAELTSRRIEAQNINEARLQKLDAATEQTYIAKFEWTDRGTLTQAAAATVEKQTLKNMVTPPVVKLRTGALVMLTCNLDLARDLGNGSIGVVKGFAAVPSAVEAASATSDAASKPNVVYPIVEFTNKRCMHITPHKWAKTDVSDHSTSVYEQVPLILAYALTTHKCVAGDTLVSTDCGLIKMEDLCAGNEGGCAPFTQNIKVYTKDGNLVMPTATYVGQEEPSLIIKTERSFKIEVSHRHPLLARGADGIERWTEASDLRLGDSLVMNFSTDKIKNIEHSACKMFDIEVPNEHNFIGNGFVNHNCQGATVEWVTMKLDRSCFADGMAYVALSRAKSLAGISLKAFHPESIQTSPHVLNFYKKHHLAGL